MVEQICVDFGYHVALTGGCLYKQGDRKDIDILFYRVRQVELNHKAVVSMMGQLESIGLVAINSDHVGRWCVQCVWGDADLLGVRVDCFFPEPTKPTTPPGEGY